MTYTILTGYLLTIDHVVVANAAKISIESLECSKKVIFLKLQELEIVFCSCLLYGSFVDNASGMSIK